MKTIDDILNRITMYRVVLYGLFLMWSGAFFLSLFNLQQFSALDLFFSSILILAVCYFTNYIFAWVYKVPTNYDSVYITAFILILIVSPNDPINNLGFLIWVSVLAMASKYILAINKKHIFNPAAIAVLITSLVLNQSASWWVANLYMLPIVVIIGYLIARKIQRFDLVLSFIASSLFFIAFWGLVRGQNLILYAGQALVYTPILFFSSVMLTEPMTTPPTRNLRIIYGLITGFIFAPFIHIGTFYSTPELSLVIGNIFSYAVSPKFKLILKFVGRDKIANNTYSFNFKTDQDFIFRPGQYLEWTVPHEDTDASGIRRYFTIASAPTENNVEIGVKFPNNPSSFKRQLLNMNLDEEVVGSQLAGDFVLPADKNQHLVFIAGGIGITPFKSMIQYLLDKGEKRPITLLYSNKKFEDIAYFDFFNMAKDKLGIDVIYTLTDTESVPAGWSGLRGRIGATTITKNIPDYENCLYYLSGPTSVVYSFRRLLLVLGIKRKNIKTDYFPGFV